MIYFGQPTVIMPTDNADHGPRWLVVFVLNLPPRYSNVIPSSNALECVAQLCHASSPGWLTQMQPQQTEMVLCKRPIILQTALILSVTYSPEISYSNLNCRPIILSLFPGRLFHVAHILIRFLSNPKQQHHIVFLWSHLVFTMLGKNFAEVLIFNCTIINAIM